MKIDDILSTKGREVVTATPDQTVIEAVRTLVEHDIGAVVVVDDDGVCGILSERDVLHLTSTDPGSLGRTRVSDAMTKDVVLGSGSDPIADVMDVMTENRIRHLPIVREGVLEGIVSIGDVVNALRREVESENRHLKDYIQGSAY